MYGSAVINRQQHTGLQELSALAGVTSSLLGPCKKYKFVHDDTSGASSLVGSCFRLTESLERTCAVGQLVSETVRAHHKVHRSGTGSLLFLAGAWSRAALESLRRGISTPHIVSALREGMDTCLNACVQNAMSLQDLVVQSNTASSPQGTQLELPPLRTVSREARGSNRQQCKVKLTCSRHFYEAGPDTAPADSRHAKPVDIACVAGAVSHGCAEAMKLVIDASRLQSDRNGQDVRRTTFDIDKVMTCLLPGVPEERSCVLPGCVVPIATEWAPIAQNFEKQKLNVVLIDGDLSEGYRHLGFNKPTGVRHVRHKLDAERQSKEDAWLHGVLETLMDLHVDLVMVRGVACGKLIQRCLAHRVLVVGKMSVSVLKAFAVATGATPVTYATQLTVHCVGTGLQVRLCGDLGAGGRGPSSALALSTAADGGLVTAVLASHVRARLRALDDQFWGCAHRLHRALKDQALLPGAGAMEAVCVHRLRSLAEGGAERGAEGGAERGAEGGAERGAEGGAEGPSEKKADPAGPTGSPYRGAVLNLMADGLVDYISTIMLNSGSWSKLEAWTSVSQRVERPGGFPAPRPEEETGGVRPGEAAAVEVCDNLSVKLEVWRKALDLVVLVLQTDAELITGVDPHTVGAQDMLTLL